jgi:hypothetical protein
MRDGACSQCRGSRIGRMPRLGILLTVAVALLAVLAPASSLAKTISSNFEFEGTARSPCPPK